LEKFECLLGESSTNYPKDKALEDIEINHIQLLPTEVHRKTELLKKQLRRRSIAYNLE